MEKYRTCDPNDISNRENGEEKNELPMGNYEILSMYSLFCTISLQHQIYVISRHLALLIEEWDRSYELKLRDRFPSHPVLHYLRGVRYRLNQVCYVPDDGRVPRALIQVMFMAFFRKISHLLELRKGRESVVFFLCMIDVWIVQPFSRYVHLSQEQHVDSSPGYLATHENAESASKSFDTSMEMSLKDQKKEYDVYLDGILSEKHPTIERLLHLTFRETIDYLYYEYPYISKKDLRMWIHWISSTIEKKYSLNGQSTFEVREDGCLEIMNDMKDIFYELLTPVFQTLTQFALNIDLSKFLKGFLEKFNETVMVYLKFMKLQERISIFEGNTDEFNSFLELTYRELQKDGDLHPGIALSQDQIDIQREEEYLVNVIQNLKRNLVPMGLFARLLELTRCHSDLTCDQLSALCHGWESCFDAVWIRQLAHQFRLWLNVSTQSDTINRSIIEVIRKNFHEIYENTVQDTWGLEDSDKNYKLASSLLRSVLQHYLDKYKETYSINWLNSPLRFLADFDNLLLESVSQIFELLQDQRLVKTWVFKNFDFIIAELNQNAFKTEYHKAYFRLERDPFLSEGARELLSEIYQTQDGNMYSPSEKHILEHQKFASLFEYLKGSFATNLARNSISLIAFRTKSKWFNRSAWSASLGNLILQLSSNLYGIDEAIGQFIMSCVEELIGDHLHRMNSMEDMVTNVCRNLYSVMAQRKSFAKDIHDFYECAQVVMVVSPIDHPKKSLADFIDKIQDESVKIKMGHYIQWRLSIKKHWEHDDDILNAIWTSLSHKFRINVWKSRYVSEWKCS